MSALDHLEGVAKRHTHNYVNEQAAEKGLLKVRTEGRDEKVTHYNDW